MLSDCLGDPGVAHIPGDGAYAGDVTEFNALAAQVIPVLLLAASFESRWLQRAPARYAETSDGHSADSPPRSRTDTMTNPTQSVGMIFLICFLGAGEFWAIWSAYAQESQTWQDAWILLATLTALVVVLLPLASLHWTDLRAVRSKSRGRVWNWVTFLGLACIAVIAVSATAALPL